MSDLLSRLFPDTPSRPVKYEDNRGTSPNGAANNVELRWKEGGTATEELSTRWRVILSYEIKGWDKIDIAQALGVSVNTIISATRDERYIEFRNKYLAEYDDEFLAMKPLAFAALKGGLSSNDENTALRASEQWFKGAGFGGFSRHEKPPETISAEDVARQLLSISASGPVQVNIVHNHNKTGREDDGE